MTSPPSFPSSLLPLISTRHPTFKFCYAKNSFRDFYLAALRVSICSYTQPPFPPSLLELGSFENFPHFVLFQLWLQMMYNSIWWFIASNILIEWVSVCMGKLSAIWSFFFWCFGNAFWVPHLELCAWLHESALEILCRGEKRIGFWFFCFLFLKEWSALENFVQDRRKDSFKSFLCLVWIQMFT